MGRESNSDKLCQRSSDGFRQKKSFGVTPVARHTRLRRAPIHRASDARVRTALSAHPNLSVHQQSRLGRSRSRNRRNLLPAGADRHRLRDDAESNPTFVARHASVP